MTSKGVVVLLYLTVLAAWGGLAYAADFTAAPVSGAAPLAVQFTDATAGSIQWSWAFGDGDSSTEQNPLHTYAGPGRYTVTLRVDTDSEWGQMVVKQDFITVSKPGHWIAVTATSSQYLVAPGGSISLTATASDSSGDAISAWSWADGSKGGKFSRPKSSTTTYVAPKTPVVIALQVTATCAGSPSTKGIGATSILVSSQQMYQSGGADQLQLEAVVELVRVPVESPYLVATNAIDGSAWVGTLPRTEITEEGIITTHPAQILHVAADGTVLWQTSTPSLWARRLDVNPGDGSCWISFRTHSGQFQEMLVHLAADGTELWRSDYPRGCPVGATTLKVNPTDGSCWLSSCGLFDHLIRVAQDGSDLLPHLPWDGSYLALNPTDGSYWLTDINTNQLKHMSASGTQLWSGGTFAQMGVPAVNAANGNCYIVDAACCGEWMQQTSVVVAFDQQGNELWRKGTLYAPWGGSVNPLDGTLWIVDGGWGYPAEAPASVVRMDADGNEIWRGVFMDAEEVSVNPNDGSCWVADTGWDRRSGEWAVGAVVRLGVVCFSWSSPMAPDNPRTFDRGTTIPVKFTLADPTGKAANGVAATLAVFAYQDGTKGAEIAFSGSNQFRNDATGKYTLNLNTTGTAWSGYSTFLAVVTINGQEFTQVFHLK